MVSQWMAFHWTLLTAIGEPGVVPARGGGAGGIRRMLQNAVGGVGWIVGGKVGSDAAVNGPVVELRVKQSRMGKLLQWKPDIK